MRRSLSLSLSLLLPSLAAVSACSAEVSPSTSTGESSAALCAVDPNRELLILDLSVVEDPARTAYPGAWSFGHLFTELAGEQDVQTFIRTWLDHFDQDQLINGFEVPRREFFRERVVGGWERASKKHGVDGLDLAHPAFRLLGIANRIDLRESCQGEVKHAGEGRFLFGFIDPSFEGTTGEETLRGTMIIEYQLPAASCAQVKKWAQAWHALGQIPLGTPEFNHKLELITRSFTDRRGDMPPVLAQVRTNELIDEFPWQWREFKIANDGLLRQTTVRNTPDTEVNRSRLLAHYVNHNEADILAGRHEVPLSWHGWPLRGASSDGEPVSTFFSAPGIHNNDARHMLSLFTCVGCHTQETGTGFFQVGPRQRGVQAFPSGFLTGTSTPDPVDPNVIRTFADLDRRANDLCGVLTTSCETLLAQPKLARPH